MAEKRPSALDPLSLPPRTGTIYPPEWAKAVVGREKRALGDPFGLTQFGVNLTTVPPGAWSSHRHWHEAEDELIYIVSGEVVLIDDDGEHVLKAGMCAGFKAGVANAHHLVNRSAQPATVLEVGTRSPNERAHYAEADMQASKTPDGWKVLRKDGSSY
jgi:uncharacterized cupin superfamily protein